MDSSGSEINEIVKLFGSRARPDSAWVSELTGVNESRVDEMLGEVGSLMSYERAIHRLLKSTSKTYYAQFPAPLELYAIARIVRPREIVESGVASGLSTAHFLMALERNEGGTLHSIDLPEFQKGERRRKGESSWSIPSGRKSGWAVPTKLKKRWDLREGKTEDLLSPLLEEIGSVDVFCHDSPWTPAHLAHELDVIKPKMNSGSVFVADNTDMNPGAVEQFAESVSAKVLRRRNSALVGIRVA